MYIRTPKKTKRRKKESVHPRNCGWKKATKSQQPSHGVFLVPVYMGYMGIFQSTMELIMVIARVLYYKPLLAMVFPML